MRGFPIKEVEQTYFDDVEIGSEIHTTPWTLELADFNQWAAAVGSYSGMTHIDTATAQKYYGTPPNAWGVHMTARLCVMLNDWIGPNGILKKIGVETRYPAYPGDTLTMSGRVTEKYVKGDDNYVECDILSENQEGKTVLRGTATVILPSKGIS